MPELPMAIHEYLLRHFQMGNPILFTGAGFSGEAMDSHGRALPTAAQLAREIWAICNPGTPFDEASTLSDLFHLALGTKKRALTELLQARLSVDPVRLPAFYEAYFALPWSRIYTINVDNLAEAANLRFPLPARLHSQSATRVDTESRPPRHDHLPIMHLNGMLADVPDNVTFSTLQYAGRQSRPDHGYSRLAADLLTHPVVFVGTRLDEGPFWQSIESRRAKGPRGTGELRPRSFLVSPSLSLARQQLLREFNVEWVPLTAQQFSEDVLLRIVGAIPAARIRDMRAQNSAARIGNTDIPFVRDLITSNPTSPSDYLMGQEPIWADIVTERAITRESDTTLLAKAQSHLGQDSRSLVLLVTGTAGSGKSTALMRACTSLSNAGNVVGHVDRSTDMTPHDLIASWHAKTEMRILAIDDADRYSGSLPGLLNQLMSRPGSLIIISMRSARVERFFRPAELPPSCYFEVAVPHLTDADIDGLIASMDRANRLGRLKGMSPPDRVKSFREQAGRQLLVAMLQATSGQRFEEKILDEYRQLTLPEKAVYSLVAVASDKGFYLVREELLVALGDASNELLNIVDGLHRRSLIVNPHPDRKHVYTLRHKEIARVVFEELIREQQAHVAVGSLARAAADGVAPHVPRSKRSWRFLKAMINHDFLQRIMDIVDARDVYASLEDLLEWDFHFWLQRGSLEVEKGDIHLAEHFLSQARSLNESDPFVQTEFAYLEFRKAIDQPRSPDAARLVESAVATLEGQILERGKETPHAYHVLGSQGLAWSRRCEMGDESRRRFLGQLVRHLEDGCKQHPWNEDIKSLRQALQTEILMTLT